MMGKIHGVSADLTTRSQISDLVQRNERNIERFDMQLLVWKPGISGAVGNFANIPPFVENKCLWQTVSAK